MLVLKYLNELDAFKRYFHLNQISRGVEFSARLLLVNFPLYILAKSPELDRVCCIVFSYLFFQVVGFSWAFLVNASKAISSQVIEMSNLHM